MENQKTLEFAEILKNGIEIGLKNALSVIGAVVLWILTIWIPYINVGTTIAIVTLPLAMSRGKIISPTEIFDAKYRKFMGEFFILQGLMFMAMIPALLLMIAPAIVLSIAWMLAVLLLIDKGLNPAEALTASNKYTNGHKWTIFLSILVFSIAVGILNAIFAGLIGGIVGKIITLLIAIASAPISMGITAYIYKTLVGTDEATEVA